MKTVFLCFLLAPFSILADAEKSDYGTILVLEDDIEFIRDQHLISDAIEKLDALVGKDG